MPIIASYPNSDDKISFDKSSNCIFIEFKISNTSHSHLSSKTFFSRNSIFASIWSEAYSKKTYEQVLIQDRIA